MRALLLIVALLVGAVTISTNLQARQPAPPVSMTNAKIAIGGYDPVAFFTKGQPTRGNPAHAYQWNGATWHFETAQSRDAFAAAPDRYAPQFGGYCAWAVSQHYLAPGDANYWKIVDGKLYLNANARAKQLWEADEADAIVRGHKNWPGVLSKNQEN